MRYESIEFTCDNCPRKSKPLFKDNNPVKILEKKGWIIESKEDNKDYCPKCAVIHKREIGGKNEEDI